MERQSQITINPVELESLFKWINDMEPKPHLIKLISGSTGIGSCTRAEIETDDGEGKWKDITDYECW
jgi:hypothetical protein